MAAACTNEVSSATNQFSSRIPIGARATVHAEGDIATLLASPSLVREGARPLRRLGSRPLRTAAAA